MRLLWLPDTLRDAGLPVSTVPGWGSRGRDMTRVRGYVSHDTVTTASWTDARVITLLRDGRPDVPGPLSQLGMTREGLMIVVAAGRSNHNGFGTWGNDSIGCEVFCAGGLAGREEQYNGIQLEYSAIAAAAILKYLGLPASRHRGHKETDPRRKIDPWGVDMDALRARTAHHMTPTPKDWYSMASRTDLQEAMREVLREQVFLAQADGKQWVISDTARQAVHIKTGDDFNRLRQAFPHKGTVDLAGYEVIA